MRATAAVQGGELAYMREGAGMPLLCLHGGMGIDSTTLRVPGIVELAQHGIEIVIFDRRGHGDSSVVAEAFYTHDQWARDIVDLAQGLGWSNYALLGHSYGGFIALEHAIRWPGRVSRLVLVATSAGPVAVRSPAYTSVAELRDHFVRVWPHFFAGDDKHVSMLEQCRFSVAPFNAAFGRELPQYDVRSQVHAITAPTLLIVGDADPYRRDMEWLAGQLPKASLHVLAKTGHFPFVEAREAFVEIVSTFLNQGAADIRRREAES